MRIILMIIMFFYLSSCQQGGKMVITSELQNDVGDQLGTATFEQLAKGVKVELELEGLSPGFHGIHIHEEPLCERPDFVSAGNHLNPEQNKHGLMHPEGSHLGDLPNIEVDKNGEVKIDMLLAHATLEDGRFSLLQKGGSAIIITENADDGMSQPSGNSGKRIACGVITDES